MKLILFDPVDFWSLVHDREGKPESLLKKLRERDFSNISYTFDHLFRGIPAVPHIQVQKESSLFRAKAGEIIMGEQDGFDFRYWRDSEPLPEYKKICSHAPHGAGEVERIVNSVGRLSWETYGVCNGELEPLTDMEQAIVNEIGILPKTDDDEREKSIDLYGKKLRAKEDLAEAYLNERVSVDLYLVETESSSRGDKPYIGHSVFGVRPEETISINPTSKKLVIPPGIEGAEPLDSFYRHVNGRESEDLMWAMNGYTCARLEKIGNVTTRRVVFDKNLWNVMQDRNFRYNSPTFLDSEGLVAKKIEQQ
jgi:hypothetical protein